MVIRVEQQDIDAALAAVPPRTNPIALALERATGSHAKFQGQEWWITRLPLFDPERQPGAVKTYLYLASYGDPLTSEGYALPTDAQKFVDKWDSGQSVAPLAFELPIEFQVQTTPQWFGLSPEIVEQLKANLQRMMQDVNLDFDTESVKRGLQRLRDEASREIDVEALKRSVEKLKQDASREIDVEPLKRNLQKLAQDAETYGRMPVSEIGRLLLKPLKNDAGGE